MTLASGGIDRPSVARIRRIAPSLSRLVAIGWGLAFAGWLSLAIWLFRHSATLPSDDALYFSRALTRFSILDFSPQFPGYPGFVLLGRAMRLAVADATGALFALTVSLALAIPAAAACIGWRTGAGSLTALAAFALALTSPFLPDLALNMISDGAGIVFVLPFFALLTGQAEGHEPESGALLAAGAALGWAACCRPSEGVLYAGAVVGLTMARPRSGLLAAAGAALVGAPTLIALYALEGPLYWTEGLRFVSGHAELWGNTVFSAAPRTMSWGGALVAKPWLLPALAAALAGAAFTAFRVTERSPLDWSLLGGFVAELLWVGAFQNPDHLRHLAPLTLIGQLMLALALRRRRVAGVLVVAAIAANALAAGWSLDPDPDASAPLQRAIAVLAQAPPGSALASNDGVETLRQALPGMHVYDAYYRADAQFGLAQRAGEAFRLSSSLIAGRQPMRTFGGRALGEPTLYLYAIK